MEPLILVFGRNGQVARELEKLGPPAGFRLEFAGRDRLDLLQDSPAGLIGELGPAAVLNASGYTAVDRAETEADAAFRLNRDAPGMMADACAASGVPFVHFSTDYVFDGTKPAPYLEADPVNPASVYGRSKAEGEARVLQSGGAAAVVRTSWVYSAFGSNFIRTMLRLAGDRDEVRVVSDQLGRPTWAEDCARVALRLCEEGGAATGLFHLSGAGDATWADFAEAIFEESAARGGPTARVSRITTAEYPTPARRPANSRLGGERLLRAIGWRARPWRESLARCFDEMRL